jgi:hypothetical protein
MKATKITYWVTTSIISLMMTYSAFAYLTKPEMAQAFKHLGFPDYFRIELAIAKVIAAILLLVPHFTPNKRMGLCRIIHRIYIRLYRALSLWRSCCYAGGPTYIFSDIGGFVCELGEEE